MYKVTKHIFIETNIDNNYLCTCISKSHAQNDSSFLGEWLKFIQNFLLSSIVMETILNDLVSKNKKEQERERNESN